MDLSTFDGVVASFVISKLAGGEILENYVKSEDFLQSLFELSLNYIDSFPSFRDSMADKGQLLLFSLVYTNIKFLLAELKTDDIYVAMFFDNSYPDGIVKILFNDYLEYVRQNYTI